eukprot:6183275-Pleurochrysis_carterae.AAC.2
MHTPAPKCVQSQRADCLSQECQGGCFSALKRSALACSGGGRSEFLRVACSRRVCAAQEELDKRALHSLIGVEAHARVDQACARARGHEGRGGARGGREGDTQIRARARVRACVLA